MSIPSDIEGEDEMPDEGHPNLSSLEVSFKDRSWGVPPGQGWELRSGV